MSVFGGMSKGERNRIKIRVRSAMAAQAKVEGRFLGGRPPYGYRLADAGPHPNPAKAADGRRLHVLEVDPVAAPVVQRIFRLFLDGMGLYLIAQTLTDDDVLSPSAADPARNRHRDGIAWSKGAVRAILINPRYTGYQVWNKQHKAEKLLDVDDVALGYETRLQWNNRDDWVWSDRPAHPAIISRETFTAAGDRLTTRTPRSERSGKRTQNPYLLRGLLVHEQCGRKMQGQWNNGHANYRCRYPYEYVIANKIDHPLTVYVREDAVIPEIDALLARAFDPDQVDASLTTFDAAQAQKVEGPANNPLRVIIADCDRKLARHRAAIEAGADPVLITSWINDIETERRRAAAQLASSPGRELGRDRPTLTKTEIADLVGQLGGFLVILEHAAAPAKAEVYRQMGLRLSHDHRTKTVTVHARPSPPVAVLVVSEGGLEPPRPLKGTSTSS